MENGRGMSKPLIYVADDCHLEFLITMFENNLMRIDKVYIVSKNGDYFKLLSEWDESSQKTSLKPIYDALQNNEIYIGIPIELYRKTEDEEKYSGREVRFLQDIKLTEFGYQVFYNIEMRDEGVK